MSLETRAIIELVNQGHLPPLCVNQKTNKKLVFHNINKSKKVRFLKKKQTHLQRSISRLKDITMKVAEKHSNAEYAGRGDKRAYRKSKRHRTELRFPFCLCPSFFFSARNEHIYGKYKDKQHRKKSFFHYYFLRNFIPKTFSILL